MRIVVSEMMWPEGLDILKRSSDVIYNPNFWSEPEKLRLAIAEADALIVRNQTQVDEVLLDQAKKLKVIGRLGVGLDNIDLLAATKRNIAVVYGKNANAISVAEYVIHAMLTVIRPLEQASHSVRQGQWDRRQFTGGELYGKTLGLIGLGEIARRVAGRANAFGMRVLGTDPFVTPYDYAVTELGIQIVSLDELLGQADFVSVHVPLTAQTRHLIDARTLSQMKPHAWLINTSRGEVIDERALDEALREGCIRGAVLDVLSQEPPPDDHPLLQHPNVLVTPHIAGLTEESQTRIAVFVAEEVLHVLAGRPSLCIVNPSVIGPKGMEVRS